jgi:hypothetical protein
MVPQQWLDSDMTKLSALATGVAIFVGFSVCYAEENERPSFATQPTSVASESGSMSIVRLSKEQILIQIAEEKRKLAHLQKLLDAQSAEAAVGGVPKKQPNKSGKTSSKSAAGDTARYQKIYLRETGYPNEPETVPLKPEPPDPCNPQRFFIRANSLDNYLYGVTPASKAKGASVSYTDDLLVGTKSAAINGMVSYVIVRDLCPTTPPGDGPFFSGYSIVPFVNGQGNYTAPRVKTEHSFLKFGVENEFEVSRWFLPRQVFTFAPYVGTDYRGLARVYGANGYWDLYDPDLHLGGYLDTNPYLGWFVQLRGETDIRQVDSTGVTNLTNRDYAWIGGTARLNMYFFPSVGAPEFRNRFSFIASASYFNDVRSGMNVGQYSATLKYKITPDGSASIAVEYNHGTNKDTLVKASQYLVSLTYAY